MSVRLLYRVLPIVCAGHRSSGWFGQVIPRTLWGLRTVHEVVHCLRFATRMQASVVVKFLFFMDALHLPLPTRSLFKVFQTAQGWSWPVARHSSGTMPLSLHRAAWFSRLFNCSSHFVVLAMSGDVSSASLVSRKLRLDGSHFLGGSVSVE